MTAQERQRHHGFFRFVQRAVYLRKIRKGRERQTFFPPELGQRIACQHLPNLGKFQHPQGSFVHVSPSIGSV